MKIHIFIIVLLLCMSCDITPPLHKDKLPNIVFIISDDDDYENFGFMGNTLVNTPNPFQYADC